MRNLLLAKWPIRPLAFSAITTRWHRVLALLVLLLSSAGAWAQTPATYGFTQSTGAYAPITGGVVAATATAADNFSLDDANFVLPAATIPFTFTYNGAGYTGLTINSNGYVTFGTTAPSTTGYTPISSGTGYTGAISGFGQDLVGDATAGSLGEIRYQTVGASPNRVFVIQFTNFKRYISAIQADNLNFQIRLNETSNVVEIVYGAFTLSTTAGTEQVGLRGASGVYNNRTSTVSWSITNGGTSSAASIASSATIKPASGLTYTFTPPGTCLPPTRVVAGSLTASGASISFVAPATAPTDYTVSIAPAGGTITPATPTASPVTISGLTASTTYTVTLSSNCSGTPSIPTSVTFTTAASCAAVTALVVGSITASTAQVTFTAPASGVTNYTVTTTPAAGGSPYTAAGSPVSLTGLATGTTYTVSVVGNCTVGGTSAPTTTTFTTPITNDEPAGAITIPLTATCTTPTSGTNVGATSTTANGYANPGCGFAFTPIDVWYKFTTAATGPAATAVQINITGSAAGQIRVFSSASGAAGPFTEVGCSAGAANNTVAPNFSVAGLTASTTYYVFVSGVGSGDTTGPFTLCVTNPPACGDPTSATITAVTTNSATVSFTPGSGNLSFTLTATPVTGPALTATGTASPLTVTGLSPATTYTLSLVATCAAGATSTPITGTITTSALPPANDECASAVTLTPGVTCTATSGTVDGATQSMAPILCNGFTGTAPAQDVWYQFTATGTTHTIAVTGTFDGVLEVLSGACGATTNVGCSDVSGNNETLTLTTLTTGTVYRLRYYPYTPNPTAKTFTICVTQPAACAAPTALATNTITTTSANVTFTASGSATSYVVTYTPAGGATTTVSPNPTASPVALSGLTPATVYTVSIVSNCAAGATSSAATTTFTTASPPPANDLCANATAITCGQTLNGTTNGATTTGEPTAACGTSGNTPSASPSVFYSFVGTGDIVTATTCGAGTTIDTELFVYSGTCGALNCVDSNDDFSGCSANTAASQVTFTSVAGTTYYFMVQRYSSTSATGDFSLSVTCVAPPACAPVTGLTAANLTPTSTNVTFTAGNGNTSYTVTYTPSGGAAQTATGTASPIALTGLTPGTTYALSVQPVCSGGGTSAATTTSFTTPFPAPANDECSSAIVLTVGAAGAACNAVSGTTIGATTSTAAGSCVGTADDDVWYSFVATNASHIITVAGASGFDAVVNLRSGACPGVLVGSCQDNTGDGGTETIAATGLTVGATYLVRVFHYFTGSGSGSFTICVTTPAPQDLTVTSGQNVTATGPYNNITVQNGGTLTLNGATSAAGAVQIQSGGLLITNCQPLTGPGSFALQTGAELRICDPAGITTTGATGAIQLAGTRSYASDASYTYNGTAAQATGAGLPATVRNLTVNNATGLTLSQAVSIAQVARLQSGNLATGGQGFTLLSSATGTALVDNTGGGVVTGTGTMQRAVTNAVTGPAYRHFSSPVVSTTLADLSTTGFAPTFNTGYNNSPSPGSVLPFPTVFGYDQARIATATSTYGPFDKGWFSPAGSGDVMQPTRGYTVNAPATATPIDFVGTFNNATQNSGALNRGTDAQAGWQLLGNPYPSPLDWSTVAAGQRPGMDAAMYVYQSTGQYAGTYRSFDNGIGISPLIDAGSGYFARVTTPGTPGAVNLTNANRVTSFGAQPAFGRGTADTRPQLHLQLTGAGLTDETFLYFEQGATTGIDAQYDATKLANPAGLDLASLNGTTPLAINGLPPLSGTDVVVPLTMRVPQAGSFSFEVADLASFGTATVYLRDALTGTQQLLAAGTRYPFALATATAGTGRFSVVFRAAGVLAAQAALTAASVSLYPNPAHASFTVLLPPLAGQREVRATLLNALGQVVLTRTIGLTAAGATAEFNTRTLATGIYTLRLEAENQAMTKRVVIE